jgi:hypothetical protein
MSEGLTRRAPRRSDEEKKDDSELMAPTNASASPTAKDSTQVPTSSSSKGKTMEDRTRIPSSAGIIFGYTFFLHFLTRFFSIETLQAWWHSMSTSAATSVRLLKESLAMFVPATVAGDTIKESTTSGYARTATILLVVFSLVYVFFVAPFRAGMWTGPRAARHRFHRYAGLLYLFMYTAAWVEYITDYDYFNEHSVLLRSIAINGRYSENKQRLSLCMSCLLFFSILFVLTLDLSHVCLFTCLLCFTFSPYICILFAYATAPQTDISCDI